MFSSNVFLTPQRLHTPSSWNDAGGTHIKRVKASDSKETRMKI
jgi:hypothetical protein